jgi:hypothetical protein
MSSRIATLSRLSETLIPGEYLGMTRMSEHNAEQEVVERHARRHVNTLSRQRSPTKRTHHWHGLQNNFISCFRHCKCNLVFLPDLD